MSRPHVSRNGFPVFPNWRVVDLTAQGAAVVFPDCSFAILFVREVCPTSADSPTVFVMEVLYTDAVLKPAMTNQELDKTSEQNEKKS
jgi:hypothetical protein